MDEIYKKIIKEDIAPMIHAGRLTLFLGAGYSIGAETTTGQTVPSTTQLIERLIYASDKEKLQPEHYPSLSVAFGRGLRKITSFDKFLRSNFADTKPKTWQLIPFRYWWRRIFTTNIDDIPKQSIGILRKQNTRHPFFEMYNFIDRAPIDIDPLLIPIVTLHGSVDRLSDGFVFRDVEYADFSAKSSDWLYDVAAQISRGHCLFVGSRFSESDIGTEISKRKIWDKQPLFENKSWIVLDKLHSKFDDDDYRSKNIIPIIATAEDFFIELEKHVQVLTPRELITYKRPFSSKVELDSSLDWWMSNFEDVREAYKSAASETVVGSVQITIN